MSTDTEVYRSLCRQAAETTSQSAGDFHWANTRRRRASIPYCRSDIWRGLGDRRRCQRNNGLLDLIAYLFSIRFTVFSSWRQPFQRPRTSDYSAESWWTPCRSTFRGEDKEVAGYRTTSCASPSKVSRSSTMCFFSSSQIDWFHLCAEKCWPCWRIWKRLKPNTRLWGLYTEISISRSVSSIGVIYVTHLERLRYVSWNTIKAILDNQVI